MCVGCSIYFDVQPEAAAEAVIQAYARSHSSGNSSSGSAAALQASDIRVVYCKYDHCK